MTIDDLIDKMRKLFIEGRVLDEIENRNQGNDGGEATEEIIEDEYYDEEDEGT